MERRQIWKAIGQRSARLSVGPKYLPKTFLFPQHGRDASMVASRSANRNHGFRVPNGGIISALESPS
jgi:hypothetical protein